MSCSKYKSPLAYHITLLHMPRQLQANALSQELLSLLSDKSREISDEEVMDKIERLEVRIALVPAFYCSTIASHSIYTLLVPTRCRASPYFFKCKSGGTPPSPIRRDHIRRRASPPMKTTCTTARGVCSGKPTRCGSDSPAPSTASPTIVLTNGTGR